MICTASIEGGELELRRKTWFWIGLLQLPHGNMRRFFPTVPFCFCYRSVTSMRLT